MAVGATAFALLLLASGCAIPGGPASMGGDSGALCVPVKVDGGILVGEILTVPDETTITITNVSLADAEGMAVQGAWVSEDLSAAISALDYPPADSATWDARADAEGAEVDATANVLAHVTRTDGVSRAAAIVVQYEAAGTTYEVRSSTRIALKDSCEDFDG